MGSFDGLTQQLAMTPPGGSWGKGGEQFGKNGKPPPPVPWEGREPLGTGEDGSWVGLYTCLSASENAWGFLVPWPSHPQKAAEQVPVQGEGSGRGLGPAGGSTIS